MVFYLNAGCLADNFNPYNLFEEIWFHKKTLFTVRAKTMAKTKAKVSLVMSKEEKALASKCATASMAELLAEEETARVKLGVGRGRQSGKAKSG